MCSYGAVTTSFMQSGVWFIALLLMADALLGMVYIDLHLLRPLLLHGFHPVEDWKVKAPLQSKNTLGNLFLPFRI
jgi:hypothetical protein